MLNPWFVTGFCAGESAFTYSRTGDGLSLYFAIKLNKDDLDLLSQIQEFFNVGTIYNVIAREPKKYSGFTQPAVYYRVTKVTELVRIVEHFDKFPLIGKKLKAYNIWKSMVLEKQRFRKPDNIKLRELALSLSSLTTKNTKIRNKLNG